MQKMEIYAGIGIGAIQYGFAEEEVIDILGEPSKSTNEEYVKGSGDWHRALFYEDRNLSFTFDKGDDFRLGTIMVYGVGYILFDRDLYGLSRKEVEDLLIGATGEKPKFEDHSLDENAPQWCLDHDGLGMLFWFDSDRLTEIQCGYLFESDSETVKWPTKAQQD